MKISIGRKWLKIVGKKRATNKPKKKEVKTRKWLRGEEQREKRHKGKIDAELVQKSTRNRICRR